MIKLYPNQTKGSEIFSNQPLFQPVNNYGVILVHFIIVIITRLDMALAVAEAYQ